MKGMGEGWEECVEEQDAFAKVCSARREHNGNAQK